MRTAVGIRHFENDAVRLAADTAGPEGGVPVLLLHGGGQTRTAWRHALDEGARRGLLMVSIDLPGHGDSSWSPCGDYSMTAHASDIRAVAAQLSSPPFLVGASLGGSAAHFYASLGHPLSGLVMVDTAPTVNAAGIDRIRTFMQSAPEGFASLDEAAAAVAAYLPHRGRPQNPSGLLRNLRLSQGRYRWHWDPRLVAETTRPRDGASLREAARRLTVPTLLVRGGLSDVLLQECVDDFLRLVPHAECADVAGADHMLAGDRNDAFNEVVFSFIARHRSR